MQQLYPRSNATYRVFLSVLTYNGLAVTQKFVKKFYKNTDSSLAVLAITDNGSTDGTGEFLDDLHAEHDNVLVTKNDENKGVIGGRNQGFDLFLDSDSELLCFLDNDQFVREGWLEQHIAVLESGYGLVSVEAWEMSESFMPRRKNVSLKQTFTYVGCGGMLIRREVVEKVGKFDEQFNPSWFEDPDYNIRTKDAGFQIGWNICARIDHLPHQTLGKSPNKREIFLRSYSRFKEKYKKRRLPRLKQRYIDVFDCVKSH